MDYWYNVMRDNHDERECREGLDQYGRVVLFRHPANAKALLIVLALVGLASGFLALRILAGEVAWFGAHEIDVENRPGNAETFTGTQAATSGVPLRLPLLALEGQEIVIHYSLKSRANSATAPNAYIYVTCPCSDEHWGYFTIDAPGSGELVMPVTQTTFYTPKFAQSSASNGALSNGIYWIGTRRARPHDDKTQYSKPWRD